MPSKYKAWIAVDPGAKGYSCLLIPDIKTIEFKSNKDKPTDILSWYSEIDNCYDIRVVLIEDVHNIYGVSSKSNFNFGYNTGFISGIVYATGVSIDKVAPKKWQKELSITSKGKDIKPEVYEKAISLYPYAQLTKVRGGKDYDKSDALMIAHYARLTYR